MKRTYTYENAVISIFIPNEASLHIKNATEIFMRKVINERIANNDNIDQTRNIREK